MALSKTETAEIEQLRVRYGTKCSVLPVGTRAAIVAVKMSPQVTCKKYFGSFNIEALKYKANEGVWYTQAPGAKSPVWTAGQGDTPEVALLSATMRTKDLLKDLEREFGILQNACLQNEVLSCPLR